MATLDSVLQTIVPQRQIFAGNGAKNEIETEGQSGSGFDDILAQSGAKVDASEDPESGKTPISNSAVPKQNNVFHQLNMQLSEKNSARDSGSEVRSLTAKAHATEDWTKVDVTAEEIKSANVDMATVDGKNFVPHTQKQKETRKIEVLNLAKVGLQFQKSENEEKTSVDPLVKKILTAGDKDLTQTLPDDIKITGEIPEKNVLLDKTEKPVKSLKHIGDKKGENATTTDAAADEPQSSQGGAKSILDILGGASVNTVLNAQTAAEAPKPKAMSAAENTVSSVLEAVSQPGKDQKTIHSGHLDDRKADRPSQKDDHVSDVDRDTLFRFSKADSTEKPVELRFGSLDKSSDAGTLVPAAPNKTENVVVLEARRYLALAPESNAFNLVSKIAGDKELSTAMTNSIIDPSKSAATSKVVNTLKLQMNPHDLGTVTATLRLRGEELSVAITVQNSAAYNHLTSDQDKMIDALRAQGFAVDQVTVQLVPSDRSSSQDQQGQPGSQGQQQQPRDGAAAQQGRQQGNGTPQDNSPSRTRQNSETLGNAGAGAVGSDRADGQVYI